MTTAIGVSKEHITKTPGVCGGKACIAGTRIRVLDIVYSHEHHGRSAKELTDFFTTPITLADVYAALAYYFDNLEEIEGLMEQDRKIAEFGKTQPSKLRNALTNNPELREKFNKLYPDE